MKKFSKLAIGTILCLTWSAPVKAALISLDDFVFGAGSITRDTDTNLEWLDVHLSQDRTFIDVAGEFGVGGEFEGFRHANVAEFETLVLNAGIPGINTVVTGNLTPFTDLINLLGATSFQDNNPETLGFLSDPTNNQLRINGDLDFLFFSGVPAYEANTLIARNESISFSTVGHYLVRSASVHSVPEPSTIFGLLAVGGLGLSLKANKRRTNQRNS
ncbi:PEP-CTERM sorting domain-containing protein [Okeania sp. SIO2B3]|uniref:PEP-CTERM sorting domain-containing protein n=1 Tax=Okeania sp. SIO2B3 TaxID=2607784 RepID=UPI0013C06D46|nr:PEP-CTERM sorting domain-containing protein [Okeania sp. SIO2B3]NET46994.1 PEP-CTERM sorting domain-containing protein [Okeania sp. SIO2B3]